MPRRATSRASVAPPEIKRIAAFAEARGVGETGGLAETSGDRVGLVRVAGEGDGPTAFLTPPPHDLGVQWHPGVDFESLAGNSQQAQDVAVFLLEVMKVPPMLLMLTIEPPVADRKSVV